MDVRIKAHHPVLLNSASHVREKNQYLHSEQSGVHSLECAMSTTREASITESIRIEFLGYFILSLFFFPLAVIMASYVVGDRSIRQAPPVSTTV